MVDKHAALSEERVISQTYQLGEYCVCTQAYEYNKRKKTISFQQKISLRYHIFKEDIKKRKRKKLSCAL